MSSRGRYAGHEALEPTRRAIFERIGKGPLAAR
jgi:hypothetical protein